MKERRATEITETTEIRSVRSLCSLCSLWLVLTLAPGCAEPEPEPDPLERARRIEADRSAAAHRAGEAGKARAEVGLRGGEAKPAPSAIKQDLLARHGPSLTPFQRSALLASKISTLAEGEAMCRKWIEENRKFDRELAD